MCAIEICDSLTAQRRLSPRHIHITGESNVVGLLDLQRALAEAASVARMPVVVCIDDDVCRRRPLFEKSAPALRAHRRAFCSAFIICGIIKRLPANLAKIRQSALRVAFDDARRRASCPDARNHALFEKRKSARREIRTSVGCNEASCRSGNRRPRCGVAPK